MPSDCVSHTILKFRERERRSLMSPYLSTCSVLGYIRDCLCWLSVVRAMDPTNVNSTQRSDGHTRLCRNVF